MVLRAQQEAIGIFEDAVGADPKDALSEFFLALHLALARQLQEAKEHCLKSIDMRGEQPAAFMLLALLATADGQTTDALDIVDEAMEEFPNHYGLTVLRLKLEITIGKSEDALTTAKDLLLFWKLNAGGGGTCQAPGGGGGPAERLPSPAGAPTPLVVVGPPDSANPAPPGSSWPPLGGTIGGGSFAAVLNSGTLMGTNSAIGLSVQQGALPKSVSGMDIADKDSVVMGAGGALSEYGGAASTVSDSLGLTGSSFQRGLQLQWKVQANIWLELAEMYLDANRPGDVQLCVEEACGTFPNSHHSLYLKGRILEQKASVSTEKKSEKILAEAKACLLGALAIFPHHIPSLRHLATVYRAEGNLSMAEKVLKDLVKLEPLDHLSWASLGAVLSEEARFEDATNCFGTASMLEACAPVMPFSVIPRMLHL